MGSNSDAFVLELRVAITADEFERLSEFYRIGLGLNPSQEWPQDQGRSLVIDLGRATLEVFDEKQAETVDEIEVGERVSGSRFAWEVPDLGAAVQRLLAYGAKQVAPARQTPWGDRTARFEIRKGCRSRCIRP